LAGTRSRPGRLGRQLVLVGVGRALAGSQAGAAGKAFASGALYYDATVLITTECVVTNVGNRSVTLSSPQIVTVVGAPGPATSDGCSGAPLAPGASCSFSGSAGVYGGGLIAVQGSTKQLRGRCSFKDPGGTEVTFSEMR
jgi:hypothetical protein